MPHGSAGKENLHGIEPFAIEANTRKTLKLILLLLLSMGGSRPHISHHLRQAKPTKEMGRGAREEQATLKGK
jgi:hypothetical protein